MAVKGKKQSRKIKFELTWGGIAGISVICFCIFLWMFIMGVWIGQSLLQPTSFAKKTASDEASAIIAPFVRAERDRNTETGK